MTMRTGHLPEIDLRPPERAIAHKAKVAGRLSVLAAVSVVAVLGAVSAFTWQGNAALNTELESAEDQVRSLENERNALIEFNEALDRVARDSQAVAETLGTEVSWADTLVAVSEALPARTWVSTLTVTQSLQVPSEGEVAGPWEVLNVAFTGQTDEAVAGVRDIADALNASPLHSAQVASANRAEEDDPTFLEVAGSVSVDESALSDRYSQGLPLVEQPDDDTLLPDVTVDAGLADPFEREEHDAESLFDPDGDVHSPGGEDGDETVSDDEGDDA